MTLQRWATRFSTLVFTLALVAASPARAQFVDFGAVMGDYQASQFGLGFASTPFGGSYGQDVVSGWGSNPFSTAGYGAVGGYGSSPYGDVLGNVQIGGGSGCNGSSELQLPVIPPVGPQPAFALQPYADAITALPGWAGSTHRLRRRHQTQPNVSRAPVRPGSRSTTASRTSSKKTMRFTDRGPVDDRAS
jgi:hypothetical protein